MFQSSINYMFYRLLEVLKECYSAWENRGKCPGDIVEYILRILKEKQVCYFLVLIILLIVALNDDIDIKKKLIKQVKGLLQ